MVKLLLENGASLNIKDVDSNEPIHYASALGRSQCLEILIQHGAHLNTWGGDSLTPLQMTIKGVSQNWPQPVLYKNRTVNAQTLLNYGASFNSKDKRQLLERAMAKKNLDIFKLFVFFEPLTKWP